MHTNKKLYTRLKITILLIRARIHIYLTRILWQFSNFSTCFIPKDKIRRDLFLDSSINRTLSRIGLNVSNYFLRRAIIHNDKARILNSKAKEMVEKEKR